MFIDLSELLSRIGRLKNELTNYMPIRIREIEQYTWQQQQQQQQQLLSFELPVPFDGSRI